MPRTRSADPSAPGPGTIAARTPMPAMDRCSGPRLTVAPMPARSARPSPPAANAISIRSMVRGPMSRPTASVVFSSARPPIRTPPRCDHAMSMSRSTSSPSAGSTESRNGMPSGFRLSRPPLIEACRPASAPAPSTSTVTSSARVVASTSTPVAESRVILGWPGGVVAVRSTCTLAPGPPIVVSGRFSPVRSTGSVPGRSTRAVPPPRSASADKPSETVEERAMRTVVVASAYGATPIPPSVAAGAVGGKPKTDRPISPDSSPPDPSSGRSSWGCGGPSGGDPPWMRDSGMAGRSRCRTSDATCCRTAPRLVTRAEESNVAVPQP